MTTIKDNFIKIDGKDSSIILVKKGLKLGLAYFGKKVRGDNFDFLSFYGDEYHANTDETPILHSVFSCTGDGNGREHLVLISDEDGNFTHRFVFENAEEIIPEYDGNFPKSREKESTVKLTFKSLRDELFANIYVSSFKDSSVFAFKTEIINKTGKTVIVKRIMSLQLDIWGSSCEVMTFDGAWARERYKHVSKISSGSYGIESNLGFSSAEHNPFFMVKLKSDDYVATNLLWTGNHKERVEISPMNYVRILTGMNDYNFDYVLKTGETLQSPEAIVCRANSQDKITEEMHGFVINHIIPQRFKNMERPVLLNNWEATSLDFNREKLLKLAKKSAEIGAELFVLDDGWFGGEKGRNVDCEALGDWTDNVKKTGGLDKLQKDINAMGLKFGLWFEPEMINPRSDLFEKHPEFTQIVPGLEPIPKRGQYVLDFANPVVCDYIVEQIENILGYVKLDYIKWDCNRMMTDAFSSSLKFQGAYYYEYMKGFYGVVRKLTENHPEILFEGCSSGGNRFDLGICYYMPQTWCSDNTDARDRVYIQEGTLYGYPQSTIGAHVSITPNQQSGNCTSLESRFNIACIGAFGYEFDLDECSEEELDAMKRQIIYYKEHRKLLQFGKYFRLGDVFSTDRGGWIIVSEDKTEAIAMLVQTKSETNGTLEGVSLKGLEDNFLYEVEMREQSNCNRIPNFKAYGSVLNNGVINIGNIHDDFDKRQNSNSISSRMLYIKKI